MTNEVKESSKDQILVPRTGYVQGKEFYDGKIAEALEDSQANGYRPLFMPELIDTRIQSPRDSLIFNHWYLSPSVRATGKTKQGNAVVVYAHVDNHFSKPENIRNAQKTLVNGAGVMPQPEFQRLVDLDGMTDEDGNQVVYVIPYDTLKKSSSGVIQVKRALEHPQTIPFIGGEERAKKYLEAHKEVYGGNIGVWHSDDLRDEPMGRLLYLGGGGGLNGYDYLDGNARFVGVRDGAQKITRPNLEQVLRILDDHVLKSSKTEVESRLKTLYK